MKSLLIFHLVCLPIMVSFAKPANYFYVGEKKEIYISSLDTAITDTYIIEIAKQDAKKNFKNVGENAVIWIVNLWATPLLGWLAPLIITDNPLSKKKIKIPNNLYSGNIVYVKAYVKEYNRIRKAKLWTNFAISSAIYVVSVVAFIFILISAFKNFSLW